MAWLNMNFEISKSLLQSFLVSANSLICVMIAAVGWFSSNQQIPVTVDNVRPRQENLPSIEYFRAQFHALSQSADNIRTLFLALFLENQTLKASIARYQKATDANQSNQSARIVKFELDDILEKEIRLIKEKVRSISGLILKGGDTDLSPLQKFSVNPSDTVSSFLNASLWTDSENLLETLHQPESNIASPSAPTDAAMIANEQDDYPSLIANVRSREALFHDTQFGSATSGRLDCFNASTCILIMHQAYGRSGNRRKQLRKVEAMLSTCSGGAISPKEVRDDVVHFPSMQIFGKSSCLPAWDRLTDMEHILGLLQTRCQVFNFSWAGKYEGMNCSLKSPPAFYRVHLDSRFPSWLEVSLESWKIPLRNDTAVLHFRGGDIFRVRPNQGYTQPVCDHYLQSFRHSGAACAVLVAADDANPCVAIVQASLNCTHRPAQCGPACAYTLLARARLVVSSFSTFLSTAIDSFSGVERRVYSAYCSDCPTRSIAASTTKLCTETNRSDLFPWFASARQLELLRTRPARVMLC